ncbi:hypothetical protein [Polaromonas eurypsychrophila]|uniref:Uncharacterized protein n=1 Tax=Polaromonas eurypsychrophila TaxID=1614635 RepID=A0A916S7G1_9BURK|nr:hypothetical protein [Polaromonas eurypsychrophila]GGA86656.1 hypothetical protein GCM10011496_04120 [Polaromonas eurypsychrophila]
MNNNIAAVGVTPPAQISPKVRVQLDANQTLMQQLGFTATPTTLYKDTDGNLQNEQGAPSSRC